MKDELASQDKPANLNSLVSLAIRLDNGLREQCLERSRQPLQQGASRSSSPTLTRSRVQPEVTQSARHNLPPTEEEPMQLGRAPLSPEGALTVERLGPFSCCLPPVELEGIGGTGWKGQSNCLCLD